MTNISKRPISPQLRQQLFEQFIDFFGTGNKQQFSKLFVALCSDAEQTMLLKRLAIIFLISEEYSTYAIAKTLIVSDATVRTMRSQCTSGKYDSVIGSMSKKTFDKERFWHTIDVLLRCGLPPRGKGRWKWLYEMK